MAIAQDAVSGSIVQSEVGSGTNSTTTITIGASATIALVFLEASLSGGANDSAIGFSTLTLGGNALTHLASSKDHSGGGTPPGTDTGGFVDIYYLQSPPTGSQTLSMTMTGGGSNNDCLLAFAVSYTGALDGAVFGTAKTNNGQFVSSLTLTDTLASGDLFVGCAANGSASPGVTTGTSDATVTGTGVTTSHGGLRVAHNSGTGSTSIVFSTNSGDYSGATGVRLIAAAATLDANQARLWVPGAPPGPAAPTQQWFYDFRRAQGDATTPVDLVVQAGHAGATGTAYDASVLTGVVATAELASGAGTGFAPSISISPNTGSAAAAGAANDASASTGVFRFVSTVSADGHYLLDQNSLPLFVYGDSPQNMVPNGTLADMGDFFADQQNRGLNSSQVHLVYNYQADAETSTAPFGSNSTMTVRNANYWATIDSMFDLAETYGFTLWVTPMDNITCGPTVEGVSDANCFSYGQFLGARYKDRVGLVWIIGNDLDSSQWAARNGKYQQIISGIQDQGDTHLVTVWNNTQPGNANTSWDTIQTIDNGYAYDTQPYLQSGPSYQLTRTGFPKPFVWFEGTYYGEHNAAPGSSSDLELRKLAWWTITWGGCGHFFGTNQTWQFSDWASETGAAIYDQLQLIPTAFAGLTGWQVLVPDFSNVFLTGGHNTYDAGDLDTDHYATAAFINGGTLGVIYFPDSTRGGSIAVDTTKLSGTVTAYWFDPTDGSTSVESTPAAPTHPGTNAGGNSDWVLILEGTSAVTVNAGHAGATGTAYAGSGTISGTSGSASSTGSAGAAASSLSLTSGAASGTGSAFDGGGTISGTSGAASGSGSAGAPAGSLGIQAPAASGTGTGFDASVSTDTQLSVDAEAASAIATAYAGAGDISGTGGAASGTGSAGDPGGSISFPSDAASGTGSGFDARADLSISGDVASGTGSASSVSGSVSPIAGVATGTGVASDATVSTDTALSVSAGQASATGTGFDPSGAVSGSSGAASSSGSAGSSAAAVALTGGASSASGSAFDATPSSGISVAAELASASGSAVIGSLEILTHGGHAAAVGTAYNANAGPTSVTVVPGPFDAHWEICLEETLCVTIDGETLFIIQ